MIDINAPTTSEALIYLLIKLIVVIYISLSFVNVYLLFSLKYLELLA